MTSLSKRSRSFTDAARAAALAARRAKALIPKGDGTEAFVVRDRDGKSLTWEIRRFGSVVVVHAEETFATQREALVAGRQALQRWRQAVSPERITA